MSKATATTVIKTFVQIKEEGFEISIPKGGWASFLWALPEEMIIEINEEEGDVPLLLEAIEEGKLSLGDIVRYADDNDFECYGLQTLKEFLER